jgi:flagella basal body P-ring formation protein FlgA
MRTLLLWLSIAASAPGAECIAITGDNIVVRDLARAIPEFGAASPEQVISFAPIPGMVRVFKAADIARLAHRLHTPLGEGAQPDVCFISVAAVLTEDQVRTAILAAIPLSVTSLKVLDFSRSPMPPGRLEFKESGLTQSSLNAPGITVWHGRLVMASRHTLPVWVKLCIIVEAKTVLSARDIEKNRALTSDDLTYSNESPFPLLEGSLRSMDEATGLMAVRNVAKGNPVLKSILERPKEVVQGQVVHVDAICGEAHLSFEGRAENSGRRGDEITVRNPNGRTFRARVIDKDKVEVRSLAGD